MIILPEYKIYKTIYTGSQSVIYRGRHVTNHRPIILKTLRPEYPTPEEIAHFRREFEITQGLKNLTRVISVYGLAKYRHSLVMLLEDFEAISLDHLDRDDPLSLADFLCLAIKICESLDQIHRQNLIHKDINPSNIVWNPASGQVKLIDFGISTLLPSEHTPLRNPTVLEGTLAYISPEQTGRMNRAVDYRTDLYSLGVTLYELLTGTLPFPATDALELVHSHLARQPIPPHQLKPELPAMISHIIMKLMAKTTEARYQSASGLQADLAACLAQWQANGRIEPFELGQADFSDHFQIPQKLYGREEEMEALVTAFDRVSQGATELLLLSGEAGSGKSALVNEMYRARVTGTTPERAGWQVYESASGEAAITALATLPPCDIALVDLHLGGLDGLTVMRRVKEQWPAAQVIIITAHATVDSAIEAVRHGAFDYLRKPCEVSDIIACVTRAITKKAEDERAKAKKEKFQPSAFRLQPAEIASLPRTKLQPPLPPTDTLPRPRLLAALQQAITAHRLTLIIAPAGYGKTTLLAEWWQQQAKLKLEGAPSQPSTPNLFQTAWLSLAADDNDLSRFLLAFIAALRSLNPNCGAAILPLLKAMTPLEAEPTKPPHPLLGQLINDILAYLPDPFALILEDSHHLTDPAIYASLDYLLEHLPAHMRLVVAAQHELPLALVRLQAWGQLARLDLADLAFTQADLAIFLGEQAQLDLAPAGLADLYRRTEGWPAGLRLLVASLNTLPQPAQRLAFISQLRQNPTAWVTQTAIGDFLAGEVLQQQGPAVQTFLLQTSLLAELTPALCQAVTGRDDAASLLTVLYRRHLFMTRILDPGSPVVDLEPRYRYHPLFAEFLRHRLWQEMPEQVADLHRRAAEAGPRPDHKIEHYLAAQLWQPAAGLIEQMGDDLLQQGRLDTLTGWIERLPASIRAAHPRLLYLLGVCAWPKNHLGLAQAYLEQAQQGFAAAGDRAGQGQALVNLATCALLQADFQRLPSLLAEAAAYPNSPAQQVQLLMARTWLNFRQADWDQAEADFAQAFAITQATGDRTVWRMVTIHLSPLLLALPDGLPRLEAICHQTLLRLGPLDDLWQMIIDWQLSFIHWWRGRLEQAVQLKQDILARSDEFGSTPLAHQADLCFGLARAHTTWGDYAEAHHFFTQLFNRLELPPLLQPVIAGYLYAQSRTYWLQGRLAEVRQIYNQITELDTEAQALVKPVVLLMLQGLLALAEHRYEAAEGHLREAVNSSARLRCALLFGQPRLLLAYLYYSWQRPQQALAELVPILAECERQQTPGLILQEGEIIIPLLRLAVQRGLQPHFATHVLQLLEITDIPHPIIPETNSTLTPREIEILQLIAAGATNQVIARQLVIALPTVKSHISRILRKLDVSSRLEAITRARELGLLRR